MKDLTESDIHDHLDSISRDFPESSDSPLREPDQTHLWVDSDDTIIRRMGSVEHGLLYVVCPDITQQLDRVIEAGVTPVLHTKGTQKRIKDTFGLSTSGTVITHGKVKRSQIKSLPATISLLTFEDGNPIIIHGETEVRQYLWEILSRFEHVLWGPSYDAPNSIFPRGEQGEHQRCYYSPEKPAKAVYFKWKPTPPESSKTDVLFDDWPGLFGANGERIIPHGITKEQKTWFQASAVKAFSLHHASQKGSRSAMFTGGKLKALLESRDAQFMRAAKGCKEAIDLVIERALRELN